MKLRFDLLGLLTAAVVAFMGCSTTQQQATQSSSTAAVHTNLVALPEAVTSFGAVTSDGWLYVFGGHKGERHQYSADMVSGSFHRLRLSEGRSWESLPSAAPGQGLAMVAHNGLVYRIGGMAARNPIGTKQDLYSSALVQCFDPRRSQWRDLPALPTARSSHDAFVVGDQLYVAGGWQLTGGTNKAIWHRTALVLDLRKPGAGWREFAQPFQRRALAMAAVGSRLFCIGGMDSDNQTTSAVDIYDVQTGEWTKGPDLPTGRHKGFSCSAITHHGRVYASAYKGDLLRLAQDERSWEVVGRLQNPRMAHRLVATGAAHLIALGGEDSEGKTPSLELLTPQLAGQPISVASDTAARQ